MQPGGIIAIHSTVHPDTCRELAELAAEHGVSLIDAPVSGGAPAVEEGTLMVMVGGDEAVVEKCRPVFATYSDAIVHLGGLGAGQVAKILNNLQFSANLGSAMSTLELGDALGIPRDRLCQVLNRGSATSKAISQHHHVRRLPRGARPDRRCAAAEGRSARRQPRRARVGPGGIGVHGGGHRAGVDGPPAVTRVGFVGAGRMGAPMVRRLVDAGHEVRVLGRTDEARQAVTELGATAVAELADAAAQADVVVVCVFTDDQVKRVCFDDGLLAAMPSGSALVLHTTGSPRTAEAIAAEAPHVAVVDAPVSGGPHDIAAGRIALFVGGDDDAVAGVRPVLSAYGDPVLHVGPLGSGQKVKLVNNMLFAAQLGLLAEASGSPPGSESTSPRCSKRAGTRQRCEPRARPGRQRRIGRHVRLRRRRVHRQGRRGGPRDGRRARRRTRRARRRSSAPEFGRETESGFTVSKASGTGIL